MNLKERMTELAYNHDKLELRGCNYVDKKSQLEMNKYTQRD